MSSVMNRRFAILDKLGVTVSKNARILDFGCGAGRTVYSLLDADYANAIGYDIRDYLDLRCPADRARFFIAEPGVNKLPFEDNSLDLIISEQVLEHIQDQALLLREMHRVLRPGGIALHEFPARYRLIEPHIYVPFGGVCAHRWWYKLWALSGIRNEFQKGLTATETADRNAFYFVEGLNYVPNSFYRVVWDRIGFNHKFVEQEQFETSKRSLTRLIGLANRFFPAIGWLYRTFHMRIVWLQKRAA